MRIKLVHKFLAINFGIIVALTATFLSLSHGYSKTMFSNALNRIDDEVMERLATTLGDHYRIHANWDALTGDGVVWRGVVDKTFFEVFFQLMAQAAKAGYANNTAAPPANQGQPAADSWNMPFGTFYERLALYDHQKNLLIAPRISNHETSELPIRFDGKVVGWLEVGKINVDMLPLAQFFFEQQLNVVLWVAVFGAVVAALFGWLLSRHVAAPIKQLTQGAREIAARNFDTRIEVKSDDELRDLADSFNTISRELGHYQAQQRIWLTNVSHELKGPLSILVGEVYAICDNLSRCDSQTAELLQSEAMHIKRMAEDLQEAFSTDEFGLQLKRSTVDLGVFFDDYLSRYEARFKAHGIVLMWIPPRMPVIAVVDSDRMAQILRNLLENALHYCHAPGRLKVALTISEGMVLLDVEDSGPGVPVESLPRLFDRLYRVESDGVRASGVGGIGLTICKQIVVAHGGEIKAMNSELGGLRIRVTLPASPTENSR